MSALQSRRRQPRARPAPPRSRSSRSRRLERSSAFRMSKKRCQSPSFVASQSAGPSVTVRAYASQRAACAGCIWLKKLCAGFNPDQMTEFGHLMSMVTSTYIPKTKLTRFVPAQSHGARAHWPAALL